MGDKPLKFYDFSTAPRHRSEGGCTPFSKEEKEAFLQRTGGTSAPVMVEEINRRLFETFACSDHYVQLEKEGDGYRYIYRLKDRPTVAPTVLGSFDPNTLPYIQHGYFSLPKGLTEAGAVRSWLVSADRYTKFANYFETNRAHLGPYVADMVGGERVRMYDLLPIGESWIYDLDIWTLHRQVEALAAPLPEESTKVAAPPVTTAAPKAVAPRTNSRPTAVEIMFCQDVSGSMDGRRVSDDMVGIMDKLRVLGFKKISAGLVIFREETTALRSIAAMDAEGLRSLLMMSQKEADSASARAAVTQSGEAALLAARYFSTASNTLRLVVVFTDTSGLSEDLSKTPSVRVIAHRLKNSDIEVRVAVDHSSIDKTMEIDIPLIIGAEVDFLKLALEGKSWKIRKAAAQKLVDLSPAIKNELAVLMKGGREEWVQWLATIGLAKAGDSSVRQALLNIALSDEDSDIRSRAIQELMNLGGAAKAELLQLALKGGSWEIQRTAAQKLVDLSPATKNELAVLMKEGREEWVRWNAAIALARAGDPAGRQTLLDSALSHEDLGLRSRAIQKIMEFGNILQPELLQLALKGGTWEIRKAAAQKLIDLAGTAKTELTVLMKEGKEAEVCRGATIALATAGDSAGLQALLNMAMPKEGGTITMSDVDKLLALGSIAKSEILQLALKADWWTQQAAAQRLIDIAEDAKAELSILMKEAGNGWVRWRAAAVLARLGDPAGRKLLVQITRQLSGASPRDKLSKASFLALSGDASQRQVLLTAALSNEDSDIRSQAIQELTKLGAAAKAELLQLALKEGSWEIRKAATQKLIDLSPATKNELAVLMKEGREEWVRWNATIALVKTGDTAGRQACLNFALSNEDSDIRSQAIQELMKLGGAAKSELLQLALRGASWKIRRAATVKLVGMGPDAKTELVALMKEGKEEWVRWQVATTLTRVGNTPMAKAELLRLARLAHDDDIRFESSVTLAEMQDPAGRALMLRYALGYGGSYSNRARNLLQGLGILDPDQGASLRTMLTKKLGDDRSSSAMMLLSMVGTSGKGIEANAAAIAALLNTEPPKVCELIATLDSVFSYQTVEDVRIILPLVRPLVTQARDELSLNTMVLLAEQYARSNTSPLAVKKYLRDLPKNQDEMHVQIGGAPYQYLPDFVVNTNELHYYVNASRAEGERKLAQLALTATKEESWVFLRYRRGDQEINRFIENGVAEEISKVWSKNDVLSAFLGDPDIQLMEISSYHLHPLANYSPDTQLMSSPEDMQSTASIEHDLRRNSYKGTYDARAVTPRGVYILSLTPEKRSLAAEQVKQQVTEAASAYSQWLNHNKGHLQTEASVVPGISATGIVGAAYVYHAQEFKALESSGLEFNAVMGQWDQLNPGNLDAWKVYYETLSMSARALQGALMAAQKARVSGIILKPFQDTAFRASQYLAKLKQFF